MVAAATRIQLDDKKVAQRQAAKRQSWQAEGWAYFDDVPEIKYGTWFSGNAMAKLRLYVAVADPADPDGAPIPINDEASPIASELATKAMGELARLRSTLGGQGEILRELNMNLEITGEAYIVGRGERLGAPDPNDPTKTLGARAEEWDVKSVSEVEAKGGVYRIKADAGDTKGEELSAEEDTIIRIWQRHPQWSQQADCAMRGVLGECETLLVLSYQVKAEANSRRSAGIFTVPNELSFGGPATTTSDQGAEAEDDPFITELLRAMTDPISDPSSAASVMPLVVRGPSEHLTPDRLRHISLSRTSDSSLDARINQRIERIARGMNLPVEVIMGHQQTTFANAGQVDEDTFEDHLEPRVLLLCDALTVGFLHPQLAAGGVAPELYEQIHVWYDASALVSGPDAGANADAAYDRFEISGETYRKVKGFTTDDEPDALERLTRAGLRRGIMTGDLTLALLNMLGEPVEVEPMPLPIPPAPAGAEEAAAALLARMVVARRNGSAQRPSALSAAVSRAPGDPGRSLMDLDRELRARLLVAADRQMERALERAGNRLKAKSGPTRDSLRSVAPLMAAATLGPRLVVAAGSSEEELLAGSFDALERQFLTWGEAAQAAALAVVAGVVGGFSPSERSALGLRQADDLAEAWSWMRTNLEALARARLFDPDPAAPELGEFDSSLRVPTGLVRQAIARAGGAAGMSAGSTGVYLALVEGDTRPAGGIATGQLLREVLRDRGAGIEGYRWSYGAAFRARPFEPHAELDGLEFINFDDPVLTNTSGFPATAYYMPGDHSGCACDVEPIVIAPTDVA